jgi:tetratricopeptide (TPR) repeat protein
MSIDRGSLLYQTGRHEMAEREFREALANEPSNALAHAMIGLCLLQRKAYADATQEAKQAIQLRPDWAFGYSTLASILNERQRLKEAAAAIDQAIALDPFNPAHLAVLAMIRLKQRKWTEALAAADRGLEIDPEYVGCVNARGMALTHLGRRDEASITIEGALSRDPQNATTHANQGWALLHSGDHRAALEHFREALRINPELKWAKTGIVESMKAANPIYRFMLRYFLFMARMSRRVRWAIVLGGWFGYQALLAAEINSPQIRPIALPLMIAYLVFVYLSWLAAPLFNLMLRLNRFGRHALSRDQRVASNWFAACLALALLFAAISIPMLDIRWLGPAVMAGLLSIPVTATFNCEAGWPRWSLAAYTAALASLGAVISLTLFFGSDGGAFGFLNSIFKNLLLAFVVGVFFSSLLANALMMSRVRR